MIIGLTGRSYSPEEAYTQVLEKLKRQLDFTALHVVSLDTALAQEADGDWLCTLTVAAEEVKQRVAFVPYQGP